MKKTFFCFRILLFFTLVWNNTVYAQFWQREFGINKTCWSSDVKETYDHGILILSQVDPGPFVPRMNAWIIKTDINGFVLWNKTIFNAQYLIAFNDIQQTLDCGLILTGITTRLDATDYDVTFLKLNACGEKEWCKIFSTPGNSDFGLRIRQIPNGYIALVKYFKDWEQKRIWLFRINETGELIWQKLYEQNDSLLYGEEGRDLMISSDGGFLITGDGYCWDPQTQLWRTRPVFIKTDSEGDEQWNLIYGLNSGYRGDVAKNPTENSSGQF